MNHANGGVCLENGVPLMEYSPPSQMEDGVPWTNNSISKNDVPWSNNDVPMDTDHNKDNPNNTTLPSSMEDGIPCTNYDIKHNYASGVLLEDVVPGTNQNLNNCVLNNNVPFGRS